MYTHCVCALILLCPSLPQISLVATAPLTNLALAVRLDPSIPSKLKGLYIMGGNTDCEFAYTRSPGRPYGAVVGFTTRWCVSGTGQKWLVWPSYDLHVVFELRVKVIVSCSLSPH